jgi:hypothetical protein
MYFKLDLRVILSIKEEHDPIVPLVCKLGPDDTRSDNTGRFVAKVANKQQALRALQTLCLGPLPTDAHAAFKWWLFVSNFGHKTARIIGPGIVRAELADKWDNGVMLLFDRQDDTQVKLEIHQPRRGSCSTRVL